MKLKIYTLYSETGSNEVDFDLPKSEEIVNVEGYNGPEVMFTVVTRTTTTARPRSTK